jgi:hypothetical protein
MEKRRHRRAVGPVGALPAAPEPRVEDPEPEARSDDDERFLRDRPPHHDREQ